MRQVLRMILSMLMLIAIGGAIAGAFFLVRHLQERQYTDLNQPAAFVELEPIYLPIVRNGELAEGRTYVLVIETRDGAPLKQVLEERPRLRDLYFTYMTALSTRAGPENLDNIPYLKDQLLKASLEMLGRPAVIGINIKNVFVVPREG